VRCVQNRKVQQYDRLDYFLVSALVLFFLFLYGKTLAVGLLTGDSAEFQVLSRELGLTHPMGYPIYILLGKLFSLLPVNELPWRINLLSAVSAALALGTLYLLARLFTRNRWIALTAPIACGLTGIFWMNAIIAEVYTTSMLASNLVLLLVISWERTRKYWLLILAGFLGGLGMGIHSMVLLLAPAILLYLAVCVASKRDWLFAAIGVIIGLLVLVGCYYGLAARNPIAGNIQTVILPNLSHFGLTATDIDTPLDRAMFIATAQQFKGTLFSLPFNQVLIYIRAYFVNINQAVGVPWSLLALVGLISFFITQIPGEQRWKDGLLLGFALLILILVPANYEIRAGIMVFFIASYSLLGLLAISGLDLIKTAFISLLTHFGWSFKQKESNPIDNGFGSLLIVLVAFYFILRLDPFNLQPAKPLSDTSKVKLAYIQWTHTYTSKDLAEEMVAQIEDGSLVFSDWNMVYPIQYVAAIQGTKPNLTVIETNPYPGIPGLSQTELDLIESSYPMRAIYFTRVVEQLEKEYRFDRSNMEPYIYRLGKK
jgi:hypothetical protein